MYLTTVGSSRFRLALRQLPLSMARGTALVYAPAGRPGGPGGGLMANTSCTDAFTRQAAKYAFRAVITVPSGSACPLPLCNHGVRSTASQEVTPLDVAESAMESVAGWLLLEEVVVTPSIPAVDAAPLRGRCQWPFDPSCRQPVGPPRG